MTEDLSPNDQAALRAVLESQHYFEMDLVIEELRIVLAENIELRNLLFAMINGDTLPDMTARLNKATE